MAKSAAALREALALKIRDELAGPVLLRMIAEYDAWMMPNSFMQVGNPPVQYALLFTDEESYQCAQQEFGIKNVPDEYLQVSGSKILPKLAGTVDSISINPCAAESISFPKHLLPELVKWGEAVDVERALSSVLQTDEGLRIIRSYSNYIVPVLQGADGFFKPFTAPDSQGRKLFAAFTFSDALNTYVFDEHDGTPADVTVYSGEYLSKWILESDCEGVVFNCRGPNRPILFTRQFAKEVLTHSAVS